jgi:hypothetical protein
MTTIHLIHLSGLHIAGEDQHTYEEWTALVDGKEDETFRPGNRMSALTARDELVAKHPDAKVVYVDQYIDYKGNRMLSGARSEIMS